MKDNPGPNERSTDDPGAASGEEKKAYVAATGTAHPANTIPSMGEIIRSADTRRRVPWMFCFAVKLAVTRQWTQSRSVDCERQGTEHTYPVESAVEAQSAIGEIWYPGKVKGVNFQEGSHTPVYTIEVSQQAMDEISGKRSFTNLLGGVGEDRIRLPDTTG